MTKKRYDRPPNSLSTIEARLRQIIKADGHDPELFARWRREIANIIIGQVIAGVTDDDSKPIFLIKGGVAMSFRLGLRARPTRDFDVACRIDRDQAIELLRDALAGGWSGFNFRLMSDPEEIRDTGAVRIDIQEQFGGTIFTRVQFEMSESEGAAGQEFDLVDQQLFELDRIGLEEPGAVPMVTAAYLIAQKLHACTDHSIQDRPNDRFRDLIDILLVEATLGPDDLPRIRAACVEIFGLRGKHSWPPKITVVDGWADGYAELARNLGYEIEDVHDAARLVDDLVDRIDATQPATDDEAARKAKISGEPVGTEGPDGPGWRWTLKTDERRYTVDVLPTGSASASDPAALVSQVGQAMETSGRWAIERCLADGKMPDTIVVNTRMVWAVGRRSIEQARPGEAVAIRNPDDSRWWKAAEVVRHGDPDEAIVVDAPAVQSGPAGPGKARRDVVVVRDLDSGDLIWLTYGEVRTRWTVL